MSVNVRIQHCAFVSVFVLYLTTPACSQGNMVVVREQTAGSLSGVVVAAGSGELLENVEVAECAANFKDCEVLAHTDRQGRFAIQSKRKDKKHYLRFVLPGMDLAEEIVTIRPFSKGLRVLLVVGT